MATTLEDFLLHNTQNHELCMIGQNGYIICSARIDGEDLFIHSISKKLLSKKVIYHVKSKVNIADFNGSCIEVPCTYIEIKT